MLYYNHSKKQLQLATKSKKAGDHYKKEIKDHDKKFITVCTRKRNINC